MKHNVECVILSLTWFVWESTINNLTQQSATVSRRWISDRLIASCVRRPFWQKGSTFSLCFPCAHLPPAIEVVNRWANEVRLDQITLLAKVTFSLGYGSSGTPLPRPASALITIYRPTSGARPARRNISCAAMLTGSSSTCATRTSDGRRRVTSPGHHSLKSADRVPPAPLWATTPRQTRGADHQRGGDPPSKSPQPTSDI